MKVETLAQRVRDAYLKAALDAYRDAGMQWLCAEGRWEAAVGALKTVDLRKLLGELGQRVSPS